MMANHGAHRVNQLVHLAKTTFRHAAHDPGFTEHLEKLKKFVSTQFCMRVRNYAAAASMYSVHVGYVGEEGGGGGLVFYEKYRIIVYLLNDYEYGCTGQGFF